MHAPQMLQQDCPCCPQKQLLTWEQHSCFQVALVSMTVLVPALRGPTLAANAAGVPPTAKLFDLPHWHHFCQRMGSPGYKLMRDSAAHLEVVPLAALLPVGELVPADGGVAVLADGQAQHVVKHVPGCEGAHSGKAHIHANDHPAEEGPDGDQTLIGWARRLLHDVQVCRQRPASIDVFDCLEVVWARTLLPAAPRSGERAQVFGADEPMYVCTGAGRSIQL